MSSTDAPRLVLDNTFGALFIGVVIAMALWGAGCVQTYYYFNRYTTDDYRLKIFVCWVWILDTTHQGLITHSAYTYLITEYGNVEFLGIIVNTLLYEVIFSALIVLSVQTFFVMRIWKLSHKNVPLLVILVLLILAGFCVTIAYTAEALKLHTYANLPKIVNLSRSINIFGAAADVAIAMSLIYLLHRSRTGFRRSDNIINRLILFSLNTGFLTSLDAVLSLITISVLPDTFVYICFFVTVSRLYTNSVLATLNGRQSLHGGLGDSSTGDTTSFALSATGRHRSRAVEIEGPSIGKANPHTLSIKVNTETETMRDSDNVKTGAPSESDAEAAFEYGDRKMGAYPMQAL